MHMVAPNSASYSRGSFIVAIDLVRQKTKRSNGYQSIRREEYHSRDSRAGMGRHGGLGMDIQHHPADDHRPRLLLHRRVAAQRIRAKGRGQKKVTADGLHPPVGGLRHARRTAAPLVCGAEERSEEDSGCCWRRAAGGGTATASATAAAARRL